MTVHQLFKKNAGKYGLPSRIRTDKGGENADVATYMLEHPRRGIGRVSVIERLWRDVYTGVLSLYHSLFNHLEECGMLDQLSNLDIFGLHMIYIPQINRPLDVWSKGWNHHKMRTTGSLSPLQQFTEGLLRIRGTESSIASETFETLEQVGLISLNSYKIYKFSLLYSTKFFSKCYTSLKFGHKNDKTMMPLVLLTGELFYE